MKKRYVVVVALSHRLYNHLVFLVGTKDYWHTRTNKNERAFLLDTRNLLSSCVSTAYQNKHMLLFFIIKKGPVRLLLLCLRSLMMVTMTWHTTLYMAKRKRSVS